MSSRARSPLVIALSILAVAPPIAAQWVTRHAGGAEGGELVVLEELGIVAGLPEGSEDLKVMMLLPDAKPEVVIAEGDLLLMIDGKRVRDVAALKAAYEAAAPGATVKLGFRRGEERFLASFERQAPQAGTRRVMMVAGGPGSDMGEIQPLEEFGVILGERDGAVVVIMEMPGAPALKQDDVLKSLNGKKLNSMADFRSAYEGLAIGDSVALVARRGDGDVEATRAKAEPSGKIRMKTSH